MGSLHSLDGIVLGVTLLLAILGRQRGLTGRLTGLLTLLGVGLGLGLGREPTSRWLSQALGHDGLGAITAIPVSLVGGAWIGARLGRGLERAVRRSRARILDRWLGVFAGTLGSLLLHGLVVFPLLGQVAPARIWAESAQSYLTWLQWAQWARSSGARSISGSLKPEPSLFGLQLESPD